jgi:hypothetical protein
MFSTNQTGTPTAKPTDSSHSSSHVGAIAGGVVGGVTLIGFIIFGIRQLRRRSRSVHTKKREAAIYSDGPVSPTATAIDPFLQRTPTSGPTPSSREKAFLSQPSAPISSVAISDIQQESPPTHSTVAHRAVHRDISTSQGDRTSLDAGIGGFERLQHPNQLPDASLEVADTRQARAANWTPDEPTITTIAQRVARMLRVVPHAENTDDAPPEYGR